mmetsp:Transcript_18523/g.34361  ORF Transcript_18523/g.34361 Transcript_18523/m.34361 type:complete len:210 (+) Transcript_18523:531-1160(+)
MVGAGLEGVGVAGGSRLDVVVSAGGDSGGGEPGPGGSGLPSVAAHGEAAPDAGAASEGVLGGVPLLVSVGDAPAVVEGLGGAERPATSAGALVTDVADEVLASGEVGGGVEGIGDGGQTVGVALTGSKIEVGGGGLVGEDGSEEDLDVSDSGVDEPRRDSSDPGRLGGIDFVDDFLTHKGSRGVEGAGGGSKEGGKQKLHDNRKCAGRV